MSHQRKIGHLFFNAAWWKTPCLLVVQDGRLRPGDQLIAINKESLIGVTHEEAKSMLNKVKFRWVVLVDLNCSLTNSKWVKSVSLWGDCDYSGNYSAVHTTVLCSYCIFMCRVSSQDSVVEIAFIPGKGLFPSSTSLHNGVQRAAGNNYNSGRLKVHIRSPEVSSSLFQRSKTYRNVSVLDILSVDSQISYHFNTLNNRNNYETAGAVFHSEPKMMRLGFIKHISGSRIGLLTVGGKI